jgi:hypothetical protein
VQQQGPTCTTQADNPLPPSPCLLLVPQISEARSAAREAEIRLAAAENRAKTVRAGPWKWAQGHAAASSLMCTATHLPCPMGLSGTTSELRQGAEVATCVAVPLSIHVHRLRSR